MIRKQALESTVIYGFLSIDLMNLLLIILLNI